MISEVDDNMSGSIGVCTRAFSTLDAQRCCVTCSATVFVVCWSRFRRVSEGYREAKGACCEV